LDPYREHPEPAPAEAPRDRGQSYRAARARLVKAGIAIVVVGMCLPVVARHCRTKTAPGVPPELLTATPTFPPAPSDLQPAVPLEPLLAQDAPDRLAVLAPRTTAQNLRPGAPFVVRFNRPMVDGAAVGKVIHPGGDPLPIVFSAPTKGRTTWTSRSSLSFEPELATWRDRHTVEVSLSPALRSLAGEAIEDALEHTIVFDNGPQLLGRAGGERIMAGEPVGLWFSGKVDAPALAPGLMVYEIDGGQRMLPFSIATSKRDERGRTRVELALRSALEPGAKLAVAVAPPFAHAGSDPRVVSIELAPRPRIEGIDCPKGTTEASGCAFTGPPGKIVDIGEALRVRASEKLAPLAAMSVLVSPPLDELRATIEEDRTIVVEGAFAPGQVYEVRFEGLRDDQDHPLVRTPPLAVRSAGKQPEIRAASGRLTYERGAPAKLPIAGIHIDAGEVRVATVPEGAELAAIAAPGALVVPKDGVTSFGAVPLSTLLPDARPNRWGEGAIDWNALAPKRSNMAVLSLLEDDDARKADSPPATFVQQTDLGIDAKVFPRGVLAWVTSIATAKPVAGAQITFADSAANPIGLVTADERGVAWLPVFDASRIEHEVLVRATHAGDRAVMVVDPRTSMTPRHFGVSPGAASAPEADIVATVITDRGIVRPGEAFHAKVLVRGRAEPGGGPGDGALVALRDRDVRLSVFGPLHEAPLFERTTRLTAFGTAAATFTLDQGARTGAYRIEARVEGHDERAGAATFTVGDYRPPTFRVDLAAPAVDLIEKDTLRVDVAATYMFGAPAAGRPASFTVTRMIGSDPEGWDDYTFHAVDASVSIGTMASGELKLDAEGRASVTAPVAIGAAMRAEAVVEVSVSDVSGQPTSTRRTLSLYPASVEVGMRAIDRWVPPGTALDLDTIVVGHDGKPVRDRPIEARIVREGWQKYWEGTDDGDDDEEDDDEEAPLQARRAQRVEVAHTCKLTSGDAPIHCKWMPQRPGTYLLEATTRDDAGRTTIASQRVYVAGPDDHPDRDRPGATVALTAKAERLRVGETAEIAFESPFPEAEAFLQVHRDGLLASETRRVGPGGNVFRFPITAEMVPNAFVSLSLVRPRTGAPGDEIDLDAPDLRVGLAELTVRPDAAPLAVEVETPETAAAGTEVPIAVRVTDDAGRGVRTELALYAVDEGTLRVTSYTTPDAQSGFFPRLAPSFAWDDLRRSLVSRVTESLLPGAGGDGSDTAPRLAPEQLERFDPTPLWLPHLVTDEDGRASATVRLPERATQYRIMAVATDAGVRSASAEANLVATMPVVVRPLLPVQATVGDRFEAVAFVHNASPIAVEVRVTPSVDGVPREERTFHIEAKSDARIAEWIDVVRPGDLAISFATATDDTRTDSVTRVLVAPRARTVRSSAVGAVQDERTLTLQPSGEGAGPITLVVASNPFVGFDFALEGLLGSRETGVEATASSLLALAAYAELDTGLRPGSLSPDEIDARAAALLQRLAILQAPSGGFGAFTSSDAPDAYLTAFALHSLSAASRAGFAVRDDVRIRAQRHLAERVRGTDFLDGGGSGTGHDELAFALRVLAEEAAPDLERTNALFNQRERLSPFGLAQLTLALGDDDFRRVTLAADALRVLFTRDHEAKRADVLRWYDGSARTLGAVLEAASAVEAVHDATPELSSRLLLARGPDGSSWGGTHETSCALAGLAAYAGVFPRDLTVDPVVTVDGVAIPAAGKSDRLARFQLPATRAGAPGAGVPQGPGAGVPQEEPRALRIAVSGTAWFALDGTTVVPLGKGDEIARGKVAALHRRFEDAAGKPLAPGAHVRLGDLVRVRLFLFTEEDAPPFVAVRDRLAGGLEPVDPGLATNPKAALSALLGMGADDEAIDSRAHYALRSLDLVSHRVLAPGEASFYMLRAGSGLHELTYGVRATTVGTFVVPPAEVSALYARDFVARSTMSTLVVDP
jgi:uncharacterized protein YfaS (alpha-2-macroglobulin family)